MMRELRPSGAYLKHNERGDLARGERSFQTLKGAFHRRCHPERNLSHAKRETNGVEGSLALLAVPAGRRGVRTMLREHLGETPRQRREIENW
jgi:hypothetical protein